MFLKLINSISNFSCYMWVGAKEKLAETMKLIKKLSLGYISVQGVNVKTHRQQVDKSTLKIHLHIIIHLGNQIIMRFVSFLGRQSLKTIAFYKCILPVMSYGAETWIPPSDLIYAFRHSTCDGVSYAWGLSISDRQKS